MTALHKATSPMQLVSKIKSQKHLLDESLTIIGTNYLERKPVICQNFDEKQWLLLIFLVYLKEVSVK